MQKRARLILIEGLPGSGKTSLAEWLCARLRAEGSHAVWIPELQRDDLQRELIRRKGEDIVSLYASYRGTCDGLVQRSQMPVLEVDAVRCSEAVVRGRVAPWGAAAITP